MATQMHNQLMNQKTKNAAWTITDENAAWTITDENAAWTVDTGTTKR